MKKDSKIRSAKCSSCFNVINKVRGVFLLAVCTLSFLSCEGQISAIDITRKGQYSVYKNDTLQSNHNTEREAQARATEVKAIYWDAEVWYTTPERFVIDIKGVPPRIDTVMVEVPVEVIKEVPVEVVVYDTITLVEEIEVPVEVVVRDTIVKEIEVPVEVVVRDTVVQEIEVPVEVVVEVEKPAVTDTIQVYGSKVLTDYTNRLKEPAPAIYYLQLRDIGVVEVEADSIPRWQKMFSLERTTSYGKTTYRQLEIPLHFVRFDVWDITETSARVNFHLSQDDFETAILSIKKADESLEWDTYMITEAWDGVVTDGPLEAQTEYLVSLYVTTSDGKEVNSGTLKFKTL